MKDEEYLFSSREHKNGHINRNTAHRIISELRNVGLKKLGHIRSGKASGTIIAKLIMTSQSFNTYLVTQHPWSKIIRR